MTYHEKTANDASATAVAPPAPARATVAIAFVQGMLAGLRHAGRDTDLLLERARIAPQVLSNPTARIPVDRYAELYNLINR